VNPPAKFICRDVADHLPDAEHNPCGDERILIGYEDNAAAEVYHIDVNGSARRHLHKSTNEIYYILEGEGELELGDDTVPLRPGVVVYVPQGTWHRAIGRKLKALVVCIPRGVLNDFHYEDTPAAP